MKNNSQKIIDEFMKLDSRIYLTYRAADKTDMFSEEMDKCVSLCEKYMAQVPRFMEASKVRGTGVPTELRGANRLVKIYEKRKEYEKAIRVCEIELSYGCYQDGSSGNVNDRLQRIVKKLQKAQS